jgi:hypothetical protein
MVLDKKKDLQSQLELPLERPQEPDRNHSRGGRSFYFFDFDDNVIYLPTPLFLFNKKTGAEKALSTSEFAKINEHLGKKKPWDDFEIRLDPHTGSFRRFRHQKLNLWQRFKRDRQPISADILEALKKPESEWKGPSWDFFWHAVHNGRPLSIITARGHKPQDLKDAVALLVKKKFLSQAPNYLSIFPVSHDETRTLLGDRELSWHTAKLKKVAIHLSVKEAFKVYGFNPTHRFGMSDDDPANVKLIIEAMQELKVQYPKNSFYVIDTQHGQLFKQEVFADSVKKPEPFSASGQLTLFDNV